MGVKSNSGSVWGRVLGTSSSICLLTLSRFFLVVKSSCSFCSNLLTIPNRSSERNTIVPFIGSIKFHFRLYLQFIVLYLSFHPTSPSIPRIVQPFAGIGQQFVAVLHQGEEIAIGWRVSTTGREGSPVVLRGIQPFAGTSEDFATIRQ